MKFKRRKRSYKKRQCTPRQRQNRLRKYMKLGMAVLGILCVALVVLRVTGVNPFKRAYSENAGEDIEAVKPDIDVELLTENPYSRPGTATDQITGIVVHYTANPGSTAMDNRNYFEGLKVLWSSIFVTLMANKIGGLQFGIYRNCQISSRVFHTAVAALPLTKANRSDFE